MLRAATIRWYGFFHEWLALQLTVLDVRFLKMPSNIRFVDESSTDLTFLALNIPPTIAMHNSELAPLKALKLYSQYT